MAEDLVSGRRPKFNHRQLLFKILFRAEIKRFYGLKVILSVLMDGGGTSKRKTPENLRFLTTPLMSEFPSRPFMLPANFNYARLGYTLYTTRIHGYNAFLRGQRNRDSLA